jgi:hypothetical protein
VPTIFRPPLIQPREKPSRPTLLDVGNNLLLTTLVVVTASPFVNLEWISPRRAPTPVVDSSWIQNLQLTTLAVPFRQSDWPSPIRPPIVRQAELPPDLLLTPGIAPPFVPFEWLTPKRIAISLPGQEQNLLATTLAPAAETLPFSLTDWPTPWRITSWRYQVDSVNLLLTTLAPPGIPGRKRFLPLMKVGF